MYIGFFIIVRLILLPVLYMLSIVLFWKDIGVCTFLLALIPLISYVLIFSYPFLNYFTTLTYTLLTLYAMNLPLIDIVFERTFIAIQLLNLSIAVFLSIIKLRLIPVSNTEQERKNKKLLNREEEMLVYIDPALQTIQAISNSACHLYGKKEDQLLGKSIDLIYDNNIIARPPKDFWPSLESNKVWHGFADIITAKNVICEERAYYSGIKNTEGQIVLIEKKILDVFIKDHKNQNFDYFYQFYEDLPVPMAVINKKHEIEKSNPEFIKNMLEKPVLNKTKFYHLFDLSIHDNIVCAVNECFNGKKSSFINHFKNIDGLCQAEYIFTPYYNTTYKNVTHVLFMLKQKTDGNTISEQDVSMNIVKVKLLDILRESLTAIYIKFPNFSTKLFGASLPDILVDKVLWKNTIILLLRYLENYNSYDSVETKKIIITCIEGENKYFFKFSLIGVFYKDMDNIGETSEWKTIMNKIQQMGTHSTIIKGEKDEVQISFVYEDF